MSKIGISTNPLLEMPSLFGSKYFVNPMDLLEKLLTLINKKD